MNCCNSLNEYVHTTNDLAQRAAKYPIRNKLRNLKDDQEFEECFPCVSFPLKYFIFDRFPFLNWLKVYSISKGIRDAIAGITVGLMVIPQGLAYANLAGLPIEYGLYSSFMGCFIYAILGTSKDITLGPTAIMSIIVSSVAMKDRDPDSFASYAVALALLSGLVQFAIGIFNLGFVVEFISYPVISGFTSAAAITIGVGQIKSLFGINLSSTNFTIGHSFVEEVYGVAKYITYATPGDIISGVTCVVILVLLKQIKSSIETWTPVKLRQSPAFFVIIKFLWLVTTARNAIIVLGAAILSFSLYNSGYTDMFLLVKDIKEGLPALTVPTINKTILSDLGYGILIAPLIGILESIAIAKAFSRKHGYKIDPSQEILAMGVANICGSFIQAYPVTGSFSRTAVNSQSGVCTPAGGIYTGVIVLLALQLLTPAFHYIPKSCLAAIIITAIYPMIDWRLPANILKVYPLDAVFWLISFLATLLIGLEEGVLIASIASLLPVLYRMLRPRIRIDHTSEHTLYVCITGGLYYSGSNYLEKIILTNIRKDQTREVKIDLMSTPEVDFTILKGLQQFAAQLNKQNINLIIINILPHLKDAFERINMNQISTYPNKVIHRSLESDLEEKDCERIHMLSNVMKLNYSTI